MHQNQLVVFLTMGVLLLIRQQMIVFCKHEENLRCGQCRRAKWYLGLSHPTVKTVVNKKWTATCKTFNSEMSQEKHTKEHLIILPLNVYLKVIQSIQIQSLGFCLDLVLDSWPHSQELRLICGMQNNVCAPYLEKLHCLHYLYSFFYHTSNFLPFSHPAPKAIFQDPLRYRVESLPNRKWLSSSLVINSPLNAHLAPLSASPSNYSLLLIVQGLAQASPAVLTAS